MKTRGARAGRLSDVLVGKDQPRDQRLRLRRFLMSLSSYVMWFGIVGLCTYLGMLDIGPGDLLRLGLLLLVTQAAIYVIIRSGLNLRLRDPSMTLLQILVGLAWSLVLIAYAREIRGVFLAVFMITLLFGIFALNKRDFLLASGAGLGGYLLLVIWERNVHPGLFSDGFYVVSVIILGGVLLWTTLFGSYVSELRFRLSARNDELESALERIRVLAEHDDLTGLYNRRYILENLRRELARARRLDSAFSVIIIDLDHFKRVNDTFGHSEGDRLLREFSRFAEDQLRAMDLVAAAGNRAGAFGRYGGEEFIVVLPDTDREGAVQAAERLRARQEQRFGSGDDSPQVTLSAGVAEFRPGESIESLLGRADRALYEAKNAGRNRVHAA